jgi:hyaluronan synthase
MDWWCLFWLYFPLGIIGFWRWGVWLFKKICASFYKPDLRDYLTTLSIITPVYNEDPEIFKRALESWRANHPDEIIAVIDETDKVCIEIFKGFAKGTSNTKLIITPKPGKRPALADGIRKAKSEIVALVDSDTIWAPDVKGRVLAPFSDPEIGGVGTRQNVINCGSVWQKMTDIFWDLRFSVEMPSLTRMGRAVTCLSGRTAVYRREALLPILDKMLGETFWSKPVISGDDKCLTRLIQESGWSSWHQGNARVFSSAPPDFKTFLKQRVRWTRNSWRSDLKSFWEGWVWKKPYLAFFTTDRFISPFTLLLSLIFFSFALWYHHWIVAGIIFGWWIFSREIKIIPHLRRRPEDILVLPVYVGINFLMAAIKIYALITINEQGWITRWSEERLKQNGCLEKIKTALAVFITLVIIAALVAIVFFILK